MDVRSTVMAWDTALRDAAWDTARSLLTDEATYVAADPPINCTSPEEIIELLHSFKGVNPDVELLALEVVGTHAIADLKQPAWEWDWFQVITVVDGRIAGLQDFATRDEAIRSAGS